MGLLRKSLIVVAALVLAAAAWLWWNHTTKVDMAAYVPGDSIIYIESNDLPRVLEGLTATEAWRALAPEGGVKNDYERVAKYSRLAAATGLGRGEWVVLARAQVALVVLGFDAAERPDAMLKLTPRFALVAETHTTERRLRGVAEKLLGDFARRAFSSREVKRSEVDGAHYLTWSDPNGARRALVAAIAGSVLVVGNDEAAVRSCLAVRRGDRPSLAGNERLGAMRERLSAGDALAFGFAPAGSAAKFVEVYAPVFVTGVTDNPQMQSVLATRLPQLTDRLVGDVGWSARFVEYGIEDRYIVSLPEGLGGQLSGPLSPHALQEFGAGAYLPRETYQVSRYTFAQPALAWRGLNAALSSRVSAVEAVFMSDALKALVAPYGVEEPLPFFEAAGAEIVTASLDETSESKVLVASARDSAELRARARAALGPSQRTEKVGDAEMLISNDDETRAVSLAGDYLLTGSAEDIRRCLRAREAAATLGDAQGLLGATPDRTGETPFVVSVQSDRVSARAVVDHLAGKRGPHLAGDSEQPARYPPYSVSRTRLTTEGFEKKTRSSFGLLGELVERLSHIGDNASTRR